MTVTGGMGLVALPMEVIWGAFTWHLEAGIGVVRQGPGLLCRDFLLSPPAIVCLLAGLPCLLLGRGRVRGQGAGVEDDCVRDQVFSQVILQEAVSELGPGDGHTGVRVCNGVPLIHGSAEQWPGQHLAAKMVWRSTSC